MACTRSMSRCARQPGVIASGAAAGAPPDPPDSGRTRIEGGPRGGGRRMAVAARLPVVRRSTLRRRDDGSGDEMVPHGQSAQCGRVRPPRLRHPVSAGRGARVRPRRSVPAARRRERATSRSACDEPDPDGESLLHGSVEAARARDQTLLCRGGAAPPALAGEPAASTSRPSLRSRATARVSTEPAVRGD